MKVDLAPGWKTELDRGPDWLFVKLYGPHGEDADAAGLADSLLLLLREEMTRRMVLELDEVDQVPDRLVVELIELHDRVDAEGGMVRVCGLSHEHQQTVRGRDQHCRLPHFRDRREAVMGFYRPGKPR